LGADVTDEYTEKLDTYVDGELSADQMKALDVHIRSCTSCAAEVLNRVRMKRALQSAGTRYHASSQFREQVGRAVGGRAPHASVFRVWLTSAVVIAVLLVAGLMTAFVGRHDLRRDQTLAELTDLHIATLASTNPVDVVSTDRHTVKPWFQGKIPFAFNLPELQNSDFVLAGGRVAYLHQAPGAELVYQVRKHYITVFIFQEDSLNGSLRSLSGRRKHASFNLETWAEGGLRYVAISDTSAEDISKLAELLKVAGRS
jgi:anti-sigma factor RsiW